MCYFFLYTLSKDHLYRNGKILQSSTVKIVSIIKESLDSIREIIIGDLYDNYLFKFGKLDKQLRRKQAISAFIGQYPRFIVEALALIILSNVAFFISKTEPSSDLLPLLAVISLGFIRLLPAIQQIYTHISRIKTFLPSIELLIECLSESC